MAFTLRCRATIVSIKSFVGANSAVDNENIEGTGSIDGLAHIFVPTFGSGGVPAASGEKDNDKKGCKTNDRR